MATSLVHEEKIVPRGLHSYQLFEQEGHFLVFNVLVHLRLTHVCNSPKFQFLPCSCSTCINVSLVTKSFNIFDVFEEFNVVFVPYLHFHLITGRA